MLTLRNKRIFAAVALGTATFVIAAVVLALEHHAVETSPFVAGDLRVEKLSHSIQILPLTAIAGVFGVLSTGLVTLSFALLVAVYLIAHRRLFTGVVLVVGVWLAGHLSQVMKLDVARPRPPNPVVDVHGFSFPSSSSAVAVFYLAAAIVIAGLEPWPKRRRQLVSTGAGIMLMVGASVIYLRGHFLSDVFAGWSIGLLVFIPLVGIATACDYLATRRRA